MTKRATLKDVAKAAGVSLASASYAVNRAGSLGEETRAHILKVAEDLGYRQNLAARATRTGRTGAIGLIVPDMTNPFFPGLMQSVVQRARASGYNVLIGDTAGDQAEEAEIVRQMIDRGVDGVIWFPVNDENSIAAVAGDLPIIVVDRTVPGFECIQADYAEGGRLAAEHLLSLGLDKIGIIAGPMVVKSMRDRCFAARDAIERAGKLAFFVENAFSPELESGVLAAIDGRTANGVFCGADQIAIGVLKHARKSGISVPEELAVVGYDDISWAEHSAPSLTTVEMPVDEMAVEAVEALLRRADGGSENSRRVVFGVNLIARESA